MAALSCALMLAGYFPYLTYAIPAVSGLFIMAVFLETGASYAVGAYAVSSVISLILTEKEVAVLYLLLFGYYPILKAFVERIKNRFLEWLIKLAVFNAAAIGSYFAASFVFGIPYENFDFFGKYGAIVFLVICNFVFVLYDFAVSRMASFYFARIHGKIKRIIK